MALAWQATPRILMTIAPVAGIVLAAGKGTRMKSELPKGLHTVCGLPMVELIGRAMKGAGIERPIMVIGHGGESVQEALGSNYSYAWQREQLGTGHAARMASEFLTGHKGAVLVLPGDTPLVNPESLCHLIQVHQESKALCTLATVEMPDASGYGRVIRDGAGDLAKIVEEKDATAEERKSREVNLSIYCFDGPTLLRLLPTLGNQNAQGEYYLTDVVTAILAEKGRVVIERFDDPDTFMGVNDRWQLAIAERVLRRRILKAHALNGVTLRDIDSIFVGPDVKIAADAVIEPCTTLNGTTSIGSGCRIGPYSIIDDSVIGDESLVYMSRLSEARLGRGVKCGPFANLRPKSVLGDRVKVGNFVEVKNAQLGEGSAASHLAYLGDASIGARTNIGAGTITCNYDGFAKHRTEIGTGAFVGSNSTLVAPITIGDGAIIAAGSVITHDVPADALGLGRSRQEVKEEWALHWRKRKKQ